MKYKKKIKVVLKSKLNAENTVKAKTTWAIPDMSYTGIVNRKKKNWNSEVWSARLGKQ